MNLQHRIDLLSRLGKYILSDDPQWQKAKERANYENGWFIPEFIELSCKNIAEFFLDKDVLEKWTANYKLQTTNHKPKNIGIVMAGNIPLVGFHDWLSVFISGHKSTIKASSKDEALISHLTNVLISWDKEVAGFIEFASMLKGCDVYIATGSNNSSRYFEYYFGKYPHIIRQNKTSIAILSGDESREELELLADDVYLYFGLGCRNVTKIYIPENYDFIPLLGAFKKYNHLAEHHKYKNNYDYNLALHILNKMYYMTNESILLVEEPSLFSPISQLNYEFYQDKKLLLSSLSNTKDIQCVVGEDFIPFGQAQHPSIRDYADGIDTLKFLAEL